MRQLQLLLHDRRRRQSGSILGALLVIVVFMAILIGALLTELTDSFLLSRELVTRVKTEATVTSAAELAIHQLQTSQVPAVCARDTRGPWFLTLNGHPAAVTQTCTSIIPEDKQSLGPGSFTVDGILDKVAGRNRYLVTDSSGHLTAYTFGQFLASWSIGLGGVASAPPLIAADPNSSLDLLTPIGSRVAVFNGPNNGGAPGFGCNLAALGAVTARPAAEVRVGGALNFPGYAFFGDTNGRLYVYDASVNGVAGKGHCAQLTQQPANTGGGVAGAPLVFPGKVTDGGTTSTVSDEVFVLVTSSSGTSLQHWRYTETTTCNGGDNGDCDGGNGQRTTTGAWAPLVNTISLSGTNAVGYALPPPPSAQAPVSGTPLSLAVATASGRLDLARITVNNSGSDSSRSYSTTLGPSAMLPNGSVASHAPYWCHCPGQDLIGVGGTNGYLYLFTTALNQAYSYDGLPDGRPGINTTPMADSSGDWYFGASDGFVYDVEIPMSGTQLFKAAKFGPGGAITGSPVVGACTAGPCLYFGSSNAGGWFYRIGSTRVSDLRACVSTVSGSASCASNPRLWARVQVSLTAIWGNSAVYVQGWSFYSP